MDTVRFLFLTTWSWHSDGMNGSFYAADQTLFMWLLNVKSSMVPCSLRRCGCDWRGRKPPPASIDDTTLHWSRQRIRRCRLRSVRCHRMTARHQGRPQLQHRDDTATFDNSAVRQQMRCCLTVCPIFVLFCLFYFYWVLKMWCLFLSTFCSIATSNRKKYWLLVILLQSLSVWEPSILT